MKWLHWLLVFSIGQLFLCIDMQEAPVAGFVKQELVESILIAKQISVNIQLTHMLGHRLSCNGKKVYC